MAGARARRIPDVYQWSPDVLMKAMNDRGQRLGLVIDLTFTDKYYNPDKAFKPFDIAHVKLESRGHGEVPSPLTVSKFFWAVRKATMAFQHQWLQARICHLLTEGVSLMQSSAVSSCRTGKSIRHVTRLPATHSTCMHCGALVGTAHHHCTVGMMVAVLTVT